jgi:hypothetical protein
MKIDLEFEVGKTIIYGQREYVITEVLSDRTIRVGVGELDLGNKHILKDCMERHPDDYAFCIAKWFIIQKRLTHSNYKSVRNANAHKHKIYIKKMIELDGLEPMDVIDILHFALTDSFWKDQLLTLSALRVRANNRLMKWENIQKSLLQARKRGQRI